MWKQRPDGGLVIDERRGATRRAPRRALALPPASARSTSFDNSVFA
jgi:hypothetical protein